MRPRRRTCARCGRARCPRRRTCARRGHPRRLGVGAHLERADLVGPAHQRGEVAGQLRLRIATSPSSTSPVEPSMVMRSPLQRADRRRHRALGDSRRGAAGARDAGLAHAARHHRGVAGHAAARGQDALGGVHAVDVLGARLDADEDDLLALGGSALGVVGGEDDLAGGGARARPAGPWRSRRARPPGRWSGAGAGRARPGRCGHRLLAVIRPSAAMSTAIFSAALAVRLPSASAASRACPARP
jgi:hypothetical protein